MRPGRPLGRRNMLGIAVRIEHKAAALYVRRLGSAIQDARRERDVDVHELAAASGLSFQTIQALERGRKRHERYLGPTVLTIVKIARALELSPADLLPL